MEIVVKKIFILIVHVKLLQILIVYKHKIIVYVINVLILTKEIIRFFVVN